MGDVDITTADFILSVGRGIGEQQNLDQFQALAAKMGATLGVSRPLVDAGWMPSAHQVGQSGHTVKPRVYLALRHLRRRAASGRHEEPVARSSPSTPIPTRRSSASPTSERWPTCSTSRRNSRGCRERHPRDLHRRLDAGQGRLVRAGGRCPSQSSPAAWRCSCVSIAGAAASPVSASVRERRAGAARVVASHSWIRRRDPVSGAGPPARLLRLSDPAGRHHHPGHPGRRRRAAGRATSGKERSTRATRWRWTSAAWHCWRA